MSQGDRITQRDLEVRLQQILQIVPSDRDRLARAIDIYSHFDDYLLRYEDDDELSVEECNIIEEFLEKIPEFKEKHKEYKNIESFLNGLSEKIKSIPDYDFDKIDSLLFDVGSENIGIAVNSLGTFLNPKEIPQEHFSQFIFDLLDDGNASTNSKDDIDKILLKDDAAFHVTCSRLLLEVCDTPQVPEEHGRADIKKWLQDDHTKFFSLVNTDHRKIWIILVDARAIGNEYNLSSLWCRVDPSDHFILMSSSLSAKEQVRAIRHECNRMIGESFQEETSENGLDSQIQDRDYRSVQLRRNEEVKRIVSRGIIQRLGVPSEATIAIDSGSSSYFYVDELFKEVENKNLWQNYKIITNNALITQLYDKYLHILNIRSISILKIGTKYNPNHKAFYRSVYDPNDMYEKICKSDCLNVLDSVIATSSFYIEDGRLWLSVDADLERKAKEFFWKLPSRRKIVLLDPSKIGSARGQERYDVFDIFDTKEDIRRSAPIILISASPRNQREEKRIEEMKVLFREDKAFHQKVEDRQLTIHFITVKETEHKNPEDALKKGNVEIDSHDVVSFKSEPKEDLKKALFEIV